MAGSGIVYTLTKRDAEQVAAFLDAQGIAAVAYSGEHETDARIDIEDRLLRNEIKAVVATSALGMGYDKPDLTFVVHYQAPGSVVSYYQQIGRAGRGVDHADIVLLRGGEDRRIQDFFIEQAFPDRERVTAVLGDLETAGEDGRTTRELMAVVNLGMGRIEAMLKILDVEGAVARDGSRWKLVPDADWTYDAERYAEVTALRRAEQRAMAAFGSDGRCLMRVLQEELDDPSPADCGRCSVCAGPRFDAPPDPALVEAAGRHLRSTPIGLEVKKMAPDPAGVMRKISNASTTRATEGFDDPVHVDAPHPQRGARSPPRSADAARNDVAEHGQVAVDVERGPRGACGGGRARSQRAHSHLAAIFRGSGHTGSTQTPGYSGIGFEQPPSPRSASVSIRTRSSRCTWLGAGRGNVRRPSRSGRPPAVPARGTSRPRLGRRGPQSGTRRWPDRPGHGRRRRGRPACRRAGAPNTRR